MEKIGELARRAQKGDLEAFSALVGQFQDMAFAVAWVRLGDELLARDAAQEGFIEAYLHIGSLREPAAFAGWLRRIVLRRCNRMVRGNGVETTSIGLVVDLAATDPDPAQELIDRELRHGLRAAIETLPEHERIAVLLHYISGYSQHQIADFLEVPAATLRKRLQSARKRLKEKMTGMEEGYFKQHPSKGNAFGRNVRFFIAVRTGDVEEVRRMLADDPELATVRERWSDTLAELYPRAQPTEQYRNALREYEQLGWAPLNWGVWRGDVAMARLLIEHGADPNGTDWRGVPLLVTAARSGNPEMVRLLLDHGADPNGGDAPFGPLHVAAAADRRKVAQLLLERGAGIERRDRFGRTPLHWGGTSGHAAMVSLLMDHGADIEATDVRGYRPLWWAVHSGHRDAAATLRLDASAAGTGEGEKGEKGGQIRMADGTVEGTVPVGESTLGRILGPEATPIDGGVDDFPERSMQFAEAAEGGPGRRNRRFFPIGIKPFDLFAPVPENGIVSLIASWGVGKIVLLHELIRTMKVVHSGRSVVITVEGGPRELADAEAGYRESGLLDSMTVILIPKDASFETRRNAVLNGLTIARHALEVEKKNVLLAVDQLALDEETVHLLRSVPMEEGASMLTVISGYHYDELDAVEPPVPIRADARIVFSFDLARRGLYPAIDPFQSSSTILSPEVVGDEHIRVVEEIRALLKAVRTLADQRERGEKNEFSQEEETMIERAARLERFLTQPFHVAQLQNGIPGEQVSAADAVKDVAALLRGEYDHLPVESFSYIGQLKEMAE